jgi:hypothetical protein
VLGFTCISKTLVAANLPTPVSDSTRVDGRTGDRVLWFMVESSGFRSRYTVKGLWGQDSMQCGGYMRDDLQTNCRAIVRVALEFMWCGYDLRFMIYDL